MKNKNIVGFTDLIKENKQKKQNTKTKGIHMSNKCKVQGSLNNNSNIISIAEYLHKKVTKSVVIVI